MADLIALAERVEELASPDRLIDYEVHRAFGVQGVGAYGAHPAYTASLDAVVALIEKELPGWGWSVTSRRPGVSYACVTEPEAVVETVRGEASSHALALLAAFLRAKG